MIRPRRAPAPRKPLLLLGIRKKTSLIGQHFYTEAVVSKGWDRPGLCRTLCNCVVSFSVLDPCRSPAAVRCELYAVRCLMDLANCRIDELTNELSQLVV